MASVPMASAPMALVRRRRRHGVLVLLAFLGLSIGGLPAGLFTPLARADTASATDAIVKRATDTRVYRSFVLDNGLRALVISDPETDKAAAALDVNVGSGSDPAGREGLAHFLEHMLFLGTAKYPKAGEYKDFMTVNGGGDNAYTSYDHTNYFFYVDQKSLEPALDRFAQFFIAPLFNPEFVTRERQVVHSEYTSKLRSDGRRIYYAGKQAMNPAHPATHFAVGDSQTLADREGSNIRDELIAFYEQHYSAGIMTLAVIGREPVDRLETWVREKFAAVPNTGGKDQRTDVAPYVPGSLPKRVNVVPVKDRRSVSYSFIVPPVKPHYRTKPLRYISDLLGHEGRGSLLSALKARTWAEGLSAGLRFNDHNAASLSVNIQLTSSGLDNLDQVSALLFGYLDLNARNGLDAWRYEELQRLSDIAFEYGEKEAAAGYVRRLANDLHEYTPADILRGGYMMSGFDPELTQRYLDHLKTENLVMTVVAQGLSTNARTDKFDVAYSVEAIDDDTIARWRSPDPGLLASLALPSANEFIPEQLALESASVPKPKPVRVIDRTGFELWHHLDTSFGVPKNNFYVSMRSNRANDTARSAVLTRLLVALVNDQLTEFSYPAYLAGMEYNLYAHVRGFSVRVSGYSDKQARLVERIASAVTSPAFDTERFLTNKTELARQLANRLEAAPYERAFGRVRDLMMRPHWGEQAMLAALDPITLDELRTFHRELLARLNVVALSHGNLDEAGARELSTIVERALFAKAEPEEVPSARIVKLEPGARLLERMSTEHNDSASLYYIQGGSKSLDERALMAVLAQMIEAPFFDVLRTRKQLGYVVFASPMPLLEVPALSLLVQSPIASAPELSAHYDEFVASYLATIEALDERALEDNKAAVLSSLLERDTRLAERTNRYWNDIDRQHFEFDTRERLAGAVQSVSLDRFKAYAAALLGPQAGRLIVEATGSAAAAAAASGNAQRSDVEKIVDAVRFKGDSRYFPG
ncbi:MAG: insulinase family protein [Gammaproteobacteria bacterium]